MRLTSLAVAVRPCALAFVLPAAGPGRGLRRAGAAAVLRRRRPVCGRPAPRRRHRRAERRDGGRPSPGAFVRGDVPSTAARVTIRADGSRSRSSISGRARGRPRQRRGGRRSRAGPTGERASDALRSPGCPDAARRQRLRRPLTLLPPRAPRCRASAGRLRRRDPGADADRRDGGVTTTRAHCARDGGARRVRDGAAQTVSPVVSAAPSPEPGWRGRGSAEPALAAPVALPGDERWGSDALAGHAGASRHGTDRNGSGDERSRPQAATDRGGAGACRPRLARNPARPRLSVPARAGLRSGGCPGRPPGDGPSASGAPLVARADAPAGPKHLAQTRGTTGGARGVVLGALRF